VGDFNVVRFPSERLGCNNFSTAMLAFLDFIEEHNLVDLPLSGDNYSWFLRTCGCRWSGLWTELILGGRATHLMGPYLCACMKI
jgi:hypothetical protein